MSRELSQYEILCIHEEVRQRLKQDVYDVRVEIVDHISCDIEQSIDADGYAPFSLLLSQKIQGLGGVRGLNDIAFAKKYELWKSYLSTHFLYLRDQMKWPYIVGSAFLLFLCFLIVSSLSTILWIYLGCVLLTELIEKIDRRRSVWYVDRQMDISHSLSQLYGYSGYLTNLPLFFLLFKVFEWPDLMIADVMASVGLFMYISFFYVRFVLIRGQFLAEVANSRAYFLTSQNLSL